MSYDIAVWKELTPITTVAAAETYGRLCDGDLGAAVPDPAIGSFLQALIAQYPPLADLSDEEIDTSPWSCGLDVSDRHVLMWMSYRRANEVVAFVQALAARHELVVFNPQGPIVVYPPSLEAMPHLRLELQDGTIIDSPGAAEVAAALQSLKSPDNTYAILERTGLEYIQVGLQSSGSFIIEFQDGSLEQHYSAHTPARSQVEAAFADYVEGGSAWRTYFPWRKVNLGAV